MAMKKDLKNYYKQIKHQLICSSNYKAKLLKQLKSSILEYFDINHPNNISEVIAEFGTADEIASSYLLTIDTDQAQKKTSIKKAIVTGAVILSITVICIFAHLFISANKKGEDGFVVNQETIIIQSE